MAAMSIAYDAKGSSCLTSELYGKPVQAVRVAGATNSAGVWKQYTSLSAKLGDLKPGRKYAIDYVEVHGLNTGTTAIPMFLRFVHSDFDGNRPGGMVYAYTKGTPLLNESRLKFSEHGAAGLHPVFSSDSPLEIWGLTFIDSGPKYIVVHVVEVTNSIACNEDLNAGYDATIADDQTISVLTPVAGDSFEVKSNRGNPVLKAFYATGSYVAFGRISCTDDIMQPSELWHASNGGNCILAPFRDVPLNPTSTMVLEINAYQAGV